MSNPTEIFNIEEVAPEHVDEHIWYKKYSELTDTYVAEEIAARYGDILKHSQTDRWLYYVDGVWRREASTYALHVAETVIREMIDEANQIKDMKRCGKVLTEVTKYLNIHNLKNAVASTERKAMVNSEEFDQHPFLLNLANGIMDLQSGQFGEHQREFYLTRQSPVKYDANARCPLWDNFLFEVMGGNTNLVEFLQKAVGYSLTGSTEERVLFILYGNGFNGKSTFLETILALLGKYEYALTTSTNTFMLNKYQQPIPNDVAALRNMRFVYASEGEIGQRLAEARIKQLTGSETVPARYLYGEWFNYRPTFKLFLGTNHKPKIIGTDDAIWDRIRLIPFTQCFRDRCDTKLGEKLQTEMPGILNWALEGCEIWIQEGLGCPQEIKEATGKYRTDSDLLGDFLDDTCEDDTRGEVSSGELYTIYKTWCMQNGEKEVSSKVFKAAMEERGYTYTKSGGKRRYLGLKIQSNY